MKETLKVGSVVIATNPCIMKGTQIASLTIGRAYVITSYHDEDGFAVIDDRGDAHNFDMSYFKHNEPVFVPLKNRVDVETLDPEIRNWLEDLVYMDPRDSEKLFEEITNVLKLNIPEGK